ncbi:hypothetical protein AMAG_04689 [Allomyces macrogynus ATCC 38327]|uniref:Uncharacterized protein n=1 Tax=Allomyces macrogynus (strain ATCC 38327) TaxID=578462 RepID=A0A0L0S650_ALLM3|nr:hypothetical protein AMAG_04689 [Allomyces macrogynus ATCC 38327]|eukprot:KNE57844.1 hypothetical protein AMAG_04689 [Allomyces macrogynus ATCC 38327]
MSGAWPGSTDRGADRSPPAFGFCPSPPPSTTRAGPSADRIATVKMVLNGVLMVPLTIIFVLPLALAEVMMGSFSEHRDLKHRLQIEVDAKPARDKSNHLVIAPASRNVVEIENQDPATPALAAMPARAAFAVDPSDTPASLRDSGILMTAKPSSQSLLSESNCGYTVQVNLCGNASAPSVPTSPSSLLAAVADAMILSGTVDTSNTSSSSPVLHLPCSTLPTQTWWSTHFTVLRPLSPHTRRILYVARPLHGDLTEQDVVISVVTAAEAERQRDVFRTACELGLNTTLAAVLDVVTGAGDAVLVTQLYAGSVRDRLRDGRALDANEAKAVCLFVLLHLSVLADMDIALVDAFKWDYILVKDLARPLTFDNLILGGIHRMVMAHDDVADSDQIPERCRTALVQFLAPLILIAGTGNLPTNLESAVRGRSGLDTWTEVRRTLEEIQD